MLRHLVIATLLILPISAQETVDHSGAAKTIPQRVSDQEPGRCSIGEQYRNLTSGKLRQCIAANTWADVIVANASGNVTIGSTVIKADDTGVYYGNGSHLTGISAGGGTWGSITGTLSDQTDLNTTLGLKTNTAVVPNTTPSAGQILAGNAGGTAYAPVTLSGDCTLASTGVITCPPAYSTASPAVTADISAVTMVTADALHSYDLSWRIDLITAGTGCTGASNVTIFAIFTDPNTSTPTPLSLGVVPLAAAGSQGTVGFIASGVDHIPAKNGTVVQYSTTYSAGAGCSPGPAYQVSPVLVKRI